MKRHGIEPDCLISSPAARARETASILCGALRIDAARVLYEDRIYLADIDELLNILSACPREMESVMLVGHNPGLEDLLTFLCGDEVPTSANGKLLPTASLAQISLPDSWRNLRRNSGQLIAITRPKEL